MDGNPFREEQERAGVRSEERKPVEEPASKPEAPEAQVAASPEVERLQAELDASRKRVDELARGVQALTRDKEDFKVRLQRERDRMIEVEKGNVALSLVEALDDLDLCLSAAAKDEGPLAQGVRMIRAGLLKRVEALGVERLDLVGRKYDPNLAEAADMEVTPNEEDDQRVTAELRAGYAMKDRVIRPARVRVAKYVAPAQA